MLLFVLPRATRSSSAPDRTRLLAATLARFSPCGVRVRHGAARHGPGAVLVRDRASSTKLLDTAFGRAALIKFGLLVGPLMALGAYNQRRLLPRLRRIAAGTEAPGRAGVAAAPLDPREVALLAVVLGVTAALVSYAPSESLATSGPVARTARSARPTSS